MALIAKVSQLHTTRPNGREHPLKVGSTILRAYRISRREHPNIPRVRLTLPASGCLSPSRDRGWSDAKRGSDKFWICRVVLYTQEHIRHRWILALRHNAASAVAAAALLAVVIRASQANLDLDARVRSASCTRLASLNQFRRIPQRSYSSRRTNDYSDDTAFWAQSASNSHANTDDYPTAHPRVILAERPADWTPRGIWSKRGGLREGRCPIRHRFAHGERRRRWQRR